MSSKRGKLANRRDKVGQSSTPITVETEHLERVPPNQIDVPEDVVAFWIPLTDVRPSPFQYRYHIDDGRLQELMESIAARELYQPITVRPLDTGTYEVVLGHRRLEAFRRLGRGTIPAIVREYDDAQAIRALLDENLKRADVNLFEQTEGVVRLLALEAELLGEPVAAVRRVLEEMRGLKRAGQELADARHLKVAQTIHDVVGTSWESFLINRLSVYRLPIRLQQKVRGGMPYSLAVAVGRLDAGLHDEALAFLEMEEGQWRSREEFKTWVAARQTVQERPQASARMKRLAQGLERKQIGGEVAARVAVLLDELEALLS